MIRLVSQRRKILLEYILKVLENDKNNLISVPWANDTIERLKRFISNGKLLRGVLVTFTEEFLYGSYSENAFKIATAIELIQTTLLINDDIIDRDNFRRGSKAIHYQYTELAKTLGIHDDSYHFGEAMGLCASYYSAFLAIKTLSEMDGLSLDLYKHIFNKFSSLMSIVGFGQMEDVFLSYVKENFTEEDIISTYVYKTSIYSFSLPMVMGALLGMKNYIDEKLIQELEFIGSNLGVIFQIRDDEIGIFSNNHILGKPVGSDIKENKKTLFTYYLLQLSSEEDKSILNKIFGKKDLTPEDIQTIRNMVRKYKIKSKVNEKIQYLSNTLKEKLKKLDVNEKFKSFVLFLINYNLSRNK